MPRCKPCTTPACTAGRSGNHCTCCPCTAGSAQPADPPPIPGAAHHQPALGRAPGPAAAACLGCDPVMLLDATQNMLPEQAPVSQAIRVIDQAQAKIALVVDAKGRLTGSVVDGDVRRGLLHGHSLQTPVSDIMHRQPYTLPVGSTRQKI